MNSASSAVRSFIWIWKSGSRCAIRQVRRSHRLIWIVRRTVRRRNSICGECKAEFHFRSEGNKRKAGIFLSLIPKNRRTEDGYKQVKKTTQTCGLSPRSSTNREKRKVRPVDLRGVLCWPRPFFHLFGSMGSKIGWFLHQDSRTSSYGTLLCSCFRWEELNRQIHG